MIINKIKNQYKIIKSLIGILIKLLDFVIL